jgi:cytochrome b subunit of formate dehydrogenase
MTKPSPQSRIGALIKMKRSNARISAPTIRAGLTRLRAGLIAGALGLALALWGTDANAQNAPAQQSTPKLTNEICLACHGSQGFTIPGPGGQLRWLWVMKEGFQHSVHGSRQCVECHTNITQIPHQKTELKVSCVTCHQNLLKAAQNGNKSAEAARLDSVVQMIDRYMKSIHARPHKDDQSRTNATCYHCHDAHYIYSKGSPNRNWWRLNLPYTCGNCHTKELDAYRNSVHGQEVLQGANPKAAICSDCHSTHDVENPALDSTRMVITKNCGNCHSKQLKSYTDTYHGQVNTLGFAYTAKCFDCHGGHDVRRVNDPASAVHANNRLETCQKCHPKATAGFVSFQPHATNHDFARYPYTWLASKFMFALLGGTFAFFWSHSALWYYREFRDRQQHKKRPHVRIDELLKGAGEGRYIQRWPAIWRAAHLAFAICVVMLVLTGMTLFYAETAWAPLVSKAFGGPRVTGLVHRIFAVAFVGIFFWHLAYVALRIGRSWKSFQWFGPDTLLPRWQDLWDAIAMFKWFFGLAPRPVFDRWTYWEKFDYWAPFWGVTIIGTSGAMLWFKETTASYLPGWVFNVATIFHGEEAVLAAGFLFTVHFFNNHWRPDKFPLDILMFTGAMPLEEFRREHTVQYDRLVQTGELSKYLVDAPSRQMTLGSKILGFALMAAGLILLTFVLIGLTQSLFGK